MTRGVGRFLLKLVVSIGLLWLVMTRLTWTEVQQALAEPCWPWLGGALALYGLSAWGGAVQWSWLLRAAGLRTPPGEIRRLYFIGLFFNNFLPANIGGDAYKILDLGRREGCPGRVFGTTLLDRLFGLAALTAVAGLAAVACLTAGISLPPVAWVLAVILLLLVGIMAALVSRRLGALVPVLLSSLRLVSAAARVGGVLADFTVYRRRLPWLAGVFLFSMGVQSLRLAVHLLVAWGLRLDPTGTQVLQLAVLVPLLALSLTLPVTINGIGLRETISSTLLVHTGLTAHAVVAMEMTAFLAMVLFSLVGGVCWWWRRERSSPPGPGGGTAGSQPC